MRNVLGLSAVLLTCVVLSSCSGNRPEKAFMGTWTGTDEGETVELSFMEQGIWIVKLPDGTTAGTWTIGPEGNAVLIYDDSKASATPTSDGRLIVRHEGESNVMVFDKADAKNK